MATNKIQIDEGSTTNLATNSFSEDAVTKHISRSVLNNSSGTEIGTNSNPLQIGDGGGSVTVDGTVAVSSISSSVTPGTGASNLGKAEDAAHTSGDVGVMALGVRKDTATALAGADGDYQPAIFDSSGRMHVNVGNTVTVGSHAVTNAGTFAVQVDGSALTSLQLIDDLVLAEDAAHVSGDPGIQILAVRKDSAAALAGIDGDYSPLQVDSTGALRVTSTGGGGSSGTEYTEDAAAASDPVGGALILRRRDTLSGTEVSADGDNIAANATAKGEIYVKHTDSIPITAASLPSHDVTNAGTFAVQVTGSALTALQTIDDIVSGSGVNVSQIGGAAAPIGAGLEASAIRVTLPTDGTGKVAAAQSGTWNITNVSGTVSLPTGAATESTLSTLNGKVTACNTGAVVISSALPAGLNAIGTLAANSGVDIGDVTINNASGASAVNIQDGGNSLTVDAPVGTPVYVRLSDGAAAISTLPVSLASVPSHAVTNAGTFAVQESGGALTALQLIDDIVLAEDAAHSSGDKGVMALAVRKDTPTQLAGTDGDYTPFTSDSNGRIRVAHGSHNKTTVSTGGTASSSGNNTLVAAGSNKIKVYAFSLSTTSSTAVTCIFQSGAGGSELWRVVLQAPSSVSTGANLVVAPPAWIFNTASATLLNLNLSAAVTVHWSVAYFDEA